MSFESLNQSNIEVAESERLPRTQKVKAALQRKLITGSIRPGEDLHDHIDTWINKHAASFGNWFNKKVEDDFGYIEELEAIGEHEDDKWKKVINSILEDIPSLPAVENNEKEAD